ncbi:hypothetical protein AGOR_G00044280 [Albula goreensis]|uniref:Ig-like domain-containing protein n=1 Tax=Albula goreensis TaxID=1534307 RepID=A0A8T3DZC8_9TELE|nr:hypothetical protein AGOR_G00044280 [Albula goreensis]
MGPSLVLMFLGIFSAVDCEIHTLQYIYTSLSKPIDVPDVYKFTAMGILDDRRIDYYNSQEKVKKPTQGWMAENLPQDYWDKGTQSRKSKEEWFNVNVKILMDRMRQNDSDVHILQWMHGCTIEKTPNGETKFVKGFDQYGYDGNDFLSFNDADMQWVAPVTEARPTKSKWDSVDILNQYTKGYLEKECVEWLEKFLTYSEAQLRQASPPEVTIFARKSLQPAVHTLVCFATGFYPKDIEMVILQNDVPLTESNGVTSSGVRPNGDGTHQLMKTLMIEASDMSNYSCLVQHRSLEQPIKKDLGKFVFMVIDCCTGVG